MKQSIKVSLFTLLAASTVMFSACKKQDKPAVEETNMSSHEENEGAGMLKGYEGLPLQTFRELTLARAATARYQHFENAIKDGYADINVVMQNMGYHYLQADLLDAEFDLTKPEILVYNKKLNGEWELVAVEYAVPLSLSPSGPPAGFTGNADVWDRNTKFQLWTLHAWIHKFNPHGVFSPMNPLVIVQ